MKKITIFTAVLLLAFFVPVFPLAAKDTETDPEKEKTVEAYYFHNTRRCASCVQLQNNSKAFLEELYHEEMEAGIVSFIAVNLQEDGGAEIARRFGVNSVSFLIASGDEFTNLTREGLMGRRNPENFKAAIKEATDGYLGRN